MKTSRRLAGSHQTSLWRLDGYDTDATGEPMSAEESNEELDDEESDDGEEVDMRWNLKIRNKLLLIE